MSDQNQPSEPLGCIQLENGKIPKLQYPTEGSTPAGDLLPEVVNTLLSNARLIRRLHSYMNQWHFEDRTDVAAFELFKKTVALAEQLSGQTYEEFSVAGVIPHIPGQPATDASNSFTTKQ